MIISKHVVSRFSERVGKSKNPRKKILNQLIYNLVSKKDVGNKKHFTVEFEGRQFVYVYCKHTKKIITVYEKRTSK